MTSPAVPFLDLHPGEDAVAVRAAIDRVLARGWFVLGPEVEAFEAEFAAATGTRHAVGVGNGTDAITLLLRGLGIGAGDEVIVPALTAAYTALAVISAGAVPVIVDVDDDTLTIDPEACAAAVTGRTRAIVPVHLYGQPAPLPALQAIAKRHGLALVEDCCQAHLATCDGVPVASTTAGGAFSFYPTKNLGGVGDGGAIATNDAQLAARVRLLRNGGQTDRYHHAVAGVNSRLDELQAAVLRARLPFLPEWTVRRRTLAGRYRERLAPPARAIVQRDAGHVYHLFPVRVGGGAHPSGAATASGRDALQAHLRERGIETLIHYPVPLHEQSAFAEYKPGACPVAARAASELLSLPLHPRLTSGQVDQVTESIAAWSTSVLIE